MLQELQAERGQEILDQEALEVQKRRDKYLTNLDVDTFMDDVDQRNFTLVNLFQLYDINKSASLTRSDFVGIVQECMGIQLTSTDIDHFFNTGVAADFEAVSDFLHWKLRQQSRKKSKAQLSRKFSLTRKNRKKVAPTKEDYRIAQKMILEKLKQDTAKQAVSYTHLTLPTIYSV